MSGRMIGLSNEGLRSGLYHAMGLVQSIQSHSPACQSGMLNIPAPQSKGMYRGGQGRIWRISASLAEQLLIYPTDVADARRAAVNL